MSTDNLTQSNQLPSPSSCSSGFGFCLVVCDSLDTLSTIVAPPAGQLESFSSSYSASTVCTALNAHFEGVRNEPKRQPAHKRHDRDSDQERS
jgi:hypothetical protein